MEIHESVTWQSKPVKLCVRMRVPQCALCGRDGEAGCDMPEIWARDEPTDLPLVTARLQWLKLMRQGLLEDTRVVN